MEKITCKGVSFTYPKSENAALREVSFTVEAGELCLLCGASAAGKTTLLKLLKKEIAPAGTLQGELLLDGFAGYVAQHVEESIVCDKVRSELSFGLTNQGKTAEEIDLAVAEIASYFNLEHLLNENISALSGGEKQLVNLAAVMVMKPEVLLLDEPCSQLDPVAAEHFLNLIVKLHHDFHLTILLSEHSSEAVFDIADSVLLLENGTVLYKDTPKKVYDFLSSQQHPLTALFPVKYRLQEYRVRPAETVAEAFSTALECKKVRFAYEKDKEVLKGLTFKAVQGKINAIIGANGSGKSTLLKVAAGVYRPYRGKVSQNGSVSMLTQNVYDLFTRERCGDEVAFGEVTDYLGISELAERHPYDLSGGQAQRLALAKVLERNADIILLDEPTRGLDALLKIKLAALLRDLCEQGKTVVLASHDIEFVGAYSDTVSFLSDGMMITTKPRREFFSSLSFYTTAVARATGGAAVSLDDLEF